MDKNAVIGELLYILANYEKGRINTNSFWRRKYINSIKKSITIIRLMIDLLQNNRNIQVVDILPLVDYLKVNADVIFPFNNQVVSQWEADNFSLVADVSTQNKYLSIIELMKKIADEITYTLNSRDTKYKVKISYLFMAFHNLPKVYLNNELITLCNIGIKPISVENALEYASSYIKLKENLR